MMAGIGRWLRRHGLALPVGALLGLVLVLTAITIAPGLWLVAKRQLPSSPTQGDILVDTPEVYTRERLVNDRFQHEAWLRDQLDRTSELIDKGRFAGTEARLTRANINTIKAEAGVATDLPGTPAGQDAVRAPTQPATTDLNPNPIDEFRDADTYRDVIRAELMRTQLDDRHDIEGNTLYRLDFDTTISPGGNTTDLAIITVTIQESEDETGSIYRQLYEDYHKEIQNTISGALRLQSQQMMGDPSGLSGFDLFALNEYLQRNICFQIERLLRTIDDDQHSGNEEIIGYKDRKRQPHHECVELIERSMQNYVNNHVKMKKDERYAQYAMELKRDLLNMKSADFDERLNMKSADFDERLPSSFIELRNVDLQAPVSDSGLFERLALMRGVFENALNYAVDRCSDAQPTSQGQISFSPIGFDEAKFRCPPDLKPKEPVLAAMGMLLRLETLVEHLKTGEASNSYPQPSNQDSAFVDELRDLVGKTPSAEVVVNRLPELIGLYGDPLVATLCAMGNWQQAAICDTEEICKVKSPQTETYCKGVGHGKFSRWFTHGVVKLVKTDYERLVAGFIQAKLSNDLSLYQFDVSLRELFPEAYVDCSLGTCDLILEPMRSVDDGEKSPANRKKSPAKRLQDELNEGARAFSYAIMPTEWNQALGTEDLTRASLLAALRAAGAGGGTNLEAAVQGVTEFEELVETRHRNPVVVGFGIEPGEERYPSGWLGWIRSMVAGGVHSGGAQGVQEVQKGNYTASGAKTHFGWIVRPRLAPAVDGGARTFRQLPGFYPLSAVVSVPSWWRSLRVEVHTDWVDPDGWLGPESVAADLAVSRGEDCIKPQCEIYDLRVPGSVNDIKEKLEFEVRTEPYIDFGATAGGQELEIGRPGQIVLEGGRLWRSTIVRMGHQQADKIFVLPDMNGIIAEFSCVEPIPGEKGLLEPRHVGPSAVNVHVWTSEGRTALPLRISLRPFVERRNDREDDGGPCFLKKKEDRAANESE